MNKQATCSYCGASKSIPCKQQKVYAGVYPATAAYVNQQTLYHDICQTCGTVLRSYVENPEKL